MKAYLTSTTSGRESRIDVFSENTQRHCSSISSTRGYVMEGSLDKHNDSSQRGWGNFLPLFSDEFRTIRVNCRPSRKPRLSGAFLCILTKTRTISVKKITDMREFMFRCNQAFNLWRNNRLYSSSIFMANQTHRF